MTVLLVEDDPGIARFIARGLPRFGFRILWERQGANVPALLRTGRFGVLILDLGLPDIDGLDLCRALRGDGVRTPILMLTARAALADRLDGFESGADDYLPKPFAFEELAARVTVLARRGAERGPEPLRFDGLEIDLTRRTAAAHDVPIALGRREFDLLATLVRDGGRVVDRASLVTAVWGEDATVSDNALEVTIGYLRRRLDAVPGAPGIETLRGRGYRLAIVAR